VAVLLGRGVPVGTGVVVNVAVSVGICVDGRVGSGVAAWTPQPEIIKIVANHKNNFKRRMWAF
jgi:hypothetical protein